jgi:methionyl-tRNA formyltransferase
MKVALFLNGWVGWKIAAWLRSQKNAEIVAVVLHPEARRKSGEKILATLGMSERDVIDGSRLKEPDVLEELRSRGAELGVSAFFGYILAPECIGMLPKGCVNVHPAYLPYNRGAYPNVWSIVDKTPAGATIHYIDQGIDTGDIIVQKQVPVSPADTGASLYQKLDRLCITLFQEAWPLLCQGTAPRKKQEGTGTTHRIKDVEAIDEIDLDATTTARELLDRIRARTFPHYRGTFIRADGRNIYVRLQMLEEDQVGGADDPPLTYED